VPAIKLDKENIGAYLTPLHHCSWNCVAAVSMQVSVWWFSKSL